MERKVSEGGIFSHRYREAETVLKISGENEDEKRQKVAGENEDEKREEDPDKKEKKVKKSIDETQTR